MKKKNYSFLYTKTPQLIYCRLPPSYNFRALKYFYIFMTADEVYAHSEAGMNAHTRNTIFYVRTWRQRL